MSLFQLNFISGHIGSEIKEGDVNTGGYRKRQYHHDVLGTYSIYRNKKAWMTKVVFVDLLRDFSQRMHNRYPGQKIALLMDNCSSHLNLGVAFDNLELIFLPPQTTAYLQPLDQGYFHQVKANIIRWQRNFIVMEEKKPTIKQKIDEFINVACRIKPEVIEKYWRMAGLIDESEPEVTFSAELHILNRIENVEQQPMERHEYAALVLKEPIPFNEENIIDENANDTLLADPDRSELEETFELREFLPQTIEYSFEVPDTAMDVLAEGFYCDEPNEDTQGSLSDEQLRQFVHSFD